MQIRAKLTMLFTLISAGILAGVLGAAWWMFKRNTEEVFFQNLHSKGTLSASSILHEPARLKALPAFWVELEQGETTPYEDNFSLYNDAYERVFAVHPEGEPAPVKTLQSIQQDGEYRFRNRQLLALGLAVNGPDNRSYLAVVEGYCDPTRVMELRNILITSFVCGMVVVAASGWYFSGQALAPVARVMDEVNDLQPADPTRRLDTRGSRDEIGRLAETFNRMLDRVERAFRTQRMFLSNVSHELKNPLMAMRAQLDVALQRERDPETYRRALQSLLDDVNAMTEVEEKLLQLARIHNDPAAIPVAPVRLDELLWQSKEQLRRNHTEYKVALLPGDMPESEETLLVQANEPLLRSAIVNLMNNACKYSPDQRTEVRVRYQVDGAHEVEVSDHGPGIPAEEQALIFEPFFRSERHRQGQVKGTGIGLALVQSILNFHHIRLSIHSPVSKEGGTAFRLHFPSRI